MILLTQVDLPYLPLPNRIEITASRIIAPEELTKTGFVIPFTLDGGVVMANNVGKQRGIEIPGGHKEGNETSEQAARREGAEETGCHVNTLIPVGYLKMISEGTVPDDYPYPHPLGYQQFFTGFIDWQDDYEPNDECGMPIKLMPNEVEQYLRPGRLALYREARKILFRE